MQKKSSILSEVNRNQIVVQMVDIFLCDVTISVSSWIQFENTKIAHNFLCFSLSWKLFEFRLVYYKWKSFDLNLFNFISILVIFSVADLLRSMQMVFSELKISFVQHPPAVIVLDVSFFDRRTKFTVTDRKKKSNKFKFNWISHTKHKEIEINKNKNYLHFNHFEAITKN